MSWQTYVDSNLLGTGKITKAAILGQQGGVWAQSAGYALSTEEQSAITKAFSDPSAVQGSGVRAAGQKFLTLRADDRSVYGKKPADGIVLVKTKQAVLVAEYAHPTLPGEATKIVEDLADYLIGVGY
ncbi:hypothetical protein JCM11251_006813 [Rhodosporidiobolus azoricus]